MQTIPTIMSVQQHILTEQRRHSPKSSGEFSWLLSGITLATKIVAAQVRRGGLVNALGAAGSENVQGESVQKLDRIANEAMEHCLGHRGSVAIMLSEETAEPVVVQRDMEHGKYIVVFDPLDGSSNIDVNVSVGTIFSILGRDPNNPVPGGPVAECLQAGTRQLAAGYVVYGPSTMMVYTTGQGAHGFTLDPSVGAYMLTHPSIQMPKQGMYYSLNEARLESYPQNIQRFIAHLREREYSSRYVGSLVADFHRTLLKGGVFLYPPTPKLIEGKLRLMYEANPIAFLAEQAGGQATDGRRRILDIVPTKIHQRTPLAVGSTYEMDLLASMSG